MSFTSNMANREVCDLIFLDYKTKAPFLNLDFANTTTTELTGETVYAYGGKGHPKRVAFDGDKGGTVTIETQMSNIKLFEMLTGGQSIEAAKYYVREELTVSEGAVTLSDTPESGSIVAYAADDDCGTALETTGSGTTVTMPTGYSQTKVIVYYMKTMGTNAKALRIKGTDFPKDFIAYGDTIMKTEDGDILPYRLTYYKLHPQPNMSLAFANNGDPGTITITCDLLVDGDGNMVDLILEAEDE